jgi:NAD(P)-dependent dehydrogenase (short-subunit alcohol dehydrogenase family)
MASGRISCQADFALSRIAAGHGRDRPPVRPLDVLVNAGASTARGTILDTTPETFDSLFATNVRGPYFLMQEAIKLMIAKGHRGRDLQHRLDLGAGGQPFINAYCASKGALTTLTANTAFSVMANRIRVNQLNVGWMASDHEREIQAAAAIPTGRRRPPPACPSAAWSTRPKRRGR